MRPLSSPDPASPSVFLSALERLERHVSMPRFFALLGVAIFFIAWNRGIALLYALFALWVGVVIISVIGARWMLRPASVVLNMPAEAVVGDTLTLSIVVTSALRPRKRLLVSMASPYPFAPAQSLFLSACGAGQLRQQRVSVTRRGVFGRNELSDVAVSCAYPLGLFSVTRKWDVAPAHITVFPRTYAVHQFALPSSSHRVSGEQDRPAASLGQELFREVREYRRGDNWRHIHWRSSARHGRLIVRQFDAIAAGESWIILDLNPANHAGKGENHSFERALEIAATIATHLIRSGQRCGLAGGLNSDGSLRLCLPPDGGATHLQAVLYALAAVKADSDADYVNVLGAMSVHYRLQQQWILFDHGIQRSRVPDFLRRAGSPLWFRFDTASFELIDASSLHELPVKRVGNEYWLARNSDFASVFL